MSVAELHDYQGPVAAALDALDAALDDLDQACLDTMSHRRLLDVMDRLERVNRRLPVTGNRVLNRLAAEANPLELGDTTLRKLVAFRLRISVNEASKRIDTAADLGPR
ncbi:MAG TPA: DUF222 domain-containing protein, partial [Mycobacterium sp.]|nr:DUF222 domain-containing protein [Mycobacterium sp.]